MREGHYIKYTIHPKSQNWDDTIGGSGGPPSPPAHCPNGDATCSSNGEEQDVQSHRHARQVLWSLLRHSPYSKPIYKGGGLRPPPQKS